MGISNEQVQLAVAAANTLREQGFFERAHAGDERAASYFARLVAYTANPGRSSDSWGALRKGGGFNVDGYADGAIVYGNDPNNLDNVLKIVTQVGSDHAGIGEAVQDRRPVDKWEKPSPLSNEQMIYLRPGGIPVPAPPTAPTSSPILLPGRGEMMAAGEWLDAYYKSEDGLQRKKGMSIGGRPDWEGVGAWLFDVYLKARIAGKSVDEAKAAVVAAIHTTEEWNGLHP